MDNNVLWLHFEDLKDELPRVIKKIAKFLDIGTGDIELLELVENQVSFAMWCIEQYILLPTHPVNCAELCFSAITG